MCAKLPMSIIRGMKVWKFFLTPKLSGYGEVGSLQSLACLAIENLVRKSLDQVGMQTIFLSEISIYTFSYFGGRAVAKNITNTA